MRQWWKSLTQLIPHLMCSKKVIFVVLAFYTLWSSVYQWRSQPKNVFGAKMYDFRGITLFVWKNSSQSTKWLYFPKIWGAMALWPPLATLWCIHTYFMANPLADFNECAITPRVCDVNAVCSNIPTGSFTCTCNPGFVGDGLASSSPRCSGKSFYIPYFCLENYQHTFCLCRIVSAWFVSAIFVLMVIRSLGLSPGKSCKIGLILKLEPDPSPTFVVWAWFRPDI